MGAQFPNGWLFSSTEGGAPEAVDKILRRLSEEWVDEYLEIEATPQAIAAFWEEWGGAKGARRIHELLVSLAQV